MQHVELRRWSMSYETICNPPSGPDCDLQFGMNYKLSYNVDRPDLSLVQLIHPATNVLRNVAGRWNIDNRSFHDDDTDLRAAVFSCGGLYRQIRDCPKEIVRPEDHEGDIETLFAVFVVNLPKWRINKTGLGFGYRAVRNDDGVFEVMFNGLKPFDMSERQRALFGNVEGLDFV